MTTITMRNHGYTVTLEGVMDMEMARELAFQMRDEWAGATDPFVWLVDARQFSGFTADAQACFEELLEEGLDRGLLRITVLGVSTAYAGLFLNIIMRADVMSLYQFLDVSYEKNFLEEMETWLMDPFSS